MTLGYQVSLLVPKTSPATAGWATTELFVHPKGTTREACVARVSTATGTASGPFSPLPGLDRQLLLLSGSVKLTHTNPGGKQICFLSRDPKKPFESLGKPHPFSGDDQTACEIMERPAIDFNVMVRRGAATAAIEVFQAEGHPGIVRPFGTGNPFTPEVTPLSADFYVVYAAQGVFQIWVGTTDDHFSLATGQAWLFRRNEHYQDPVPWAIAGQNNPALIGVGISL